MHGIYTNVELGAGKESHSLFGDKMTGQWITMFLNIYLFVLVFGSSLQALAGYEFSGFWRRVGSKGEANVLEQLAPFIFRMMKLALNIS